MERANPQSFFQEVRSRELHGFRVRKRPYSGDASVGFSEVGALAVESNGYPTPPLAISFCKTSKNSHILAVSDEDGCVRLFDSRRRLPSLASYQENAEKARLYDWIAHDNAVFDVTWMKDDMRMLTASGDQTIKVWDSQEKKCIGVLVEHKGSVKSLSPHPSNPDLVVSGSRDGSFALWDLRCGSKTRRGDVYISSMAVVKGAHLPPQLKRNRHGKTASMSITSVLYLKDEVSVATAGAVDSVVKFWDTRNLKALLTQTCPHSSSVEKKESLHGISSLSQDSSGVLISASCMDHRIYLYNVLNLEKGHIKSFSGCQIESFYVKSTISPDAAHILSGSSDGNAYIWQVNKPLVDPISLKSHEGEVTAVDWCSSELGRIATSSDDFTVRIWDMQSSFFSSSRFPSSIRRRVMAIPSMQARNSSMHEEPSSSTKVASSLFPSDEAADQTKHHVPITVPKICTPESQKKKFPLELDLLETFEKTPDGAMKSPASVLNPPPSLKRRTIRDYFVAAS